MIHGAASGVDSIGAQSAKYLGLSSESHPAIWKVQGVFQPSAGPVRNEKMLTLGVDFALVFSGGRGTADMEKRLVKAGIPCRYYPSS